MVGNAQSPRIQEQEFNLELIADRTFRYFAIWRVALLAAIVGFIAIFVFSVLPSLTVSGLLLFYGSFSVLFLGLAAYCSLVLYTLSRPPIRAQLQSDRLTFAYANGRTIAFRWDDPRVRIRLRRWPPAPDQRWEKPYNFEIELTFAPNPVLDFELATAILQAARSHGLVSRTVTEPVRDTGKVPNEVTIISHPSRVGV
jgi:hypothetical protein